MGFDEKNRCLMFWKNKINYRKFTWRIMVEHAKILQRQCGKFADKTGSMVIAATKDVAEYPKRHINYIKKRGQFL